MFFSNNRMGRIYICGLRDCRFEDMAGNTLGRHFRLTTYGESHGPEIGGVIDGCPAGLRIDWDLVRADMERRRPGQSALTSPRDEKDEFEVVSGLFEGMTTGSPIGFRIPNADVRSRDYDHLARGFRPSHGDFTWQAKFGHRDHRGGGRLSARETAARVLAGGVARQLAAAWGMEVSAYVERVERVGMPQAPRFWSRQEVDRHPVRCPDPAVAEAMAERIQWARQQGDTLGGTVVVVARGVPAGLGAPVFDKLQASLAHALWSLPAVKGMELGSGFSGTHMLGSQHNDAFIPDPASPHGIKTETNHSGGIQGGISNGEDLVVRLAFKPVSTLLQPQMSVDDQGQPMAWEGRGRHDPCVLPRAVALVEAMVLLVLVDSAMDSRNDRFTSLH
jgi:chorismate synthase